MATNPQDSRLRYEAERAAIIFEAQEHDRWARAHSFVYRHAGAFSTAGFVMIIICIAGIFLDGYSEDALWRMWTYLGLGYGGTITILFTLVRGDTKNWFRAILRVVVMLTLMAALLVPMYFGMNALLQALIG